MPPIRRRSATPRRRWRADRALDRDLPPIRSTPASAPFQFEVHARYNPEQLTVLNIVPGLICIVLRFSTLFVTTLSITREPSAARWRICWRCRCGRSR
jgi:hypothetical protein